MSIFIVHAHSHASAIRKSATITGLFAILGLVIILNAVERGLIEGGRVVSAVSIA